VLKRAGHTEATVDLCRLAGKFPGGVLCEIVTADKSGMARLPELEAFAAEHDLPLISIADLIRYRRHTRSWCAGSPRRPCPPSTDFQAYVFESMLDGEQHLALVYGDISRTRDVLVRVHSECLTGDVFGSMRCDCGPQLQTALAKIAAEGAGVVVYLRGHEGAASASATRSAPTPSKRTAATPSTPTSSSGCRSTRASTASAPRSWSTWASPRCA
jgi:3,4-dihydroxy 2-butanone 4-phosphate synthase / GTP cyclohydrolase II